MSQDAALIINPRLREVLAEREGLREALAGMAPHLCAKPFQMIHRHFGPETPPEVLGVWIVGSKAQVAAVQRIVESSTDDVSLTSALSAWQDRWPDFKRAPRRKPAKLGWRIRVYLATVAAYGPLPMAA